VAAVETDLARHKTSVEDRSRGPRSRTREKVAGI